MADPVDIRFMREFSQIGNALAAPASPEAGFGLPPGPLVSGSTGAVGQAEDVLDPVQLARVLSGANVPPAIAAMEGLAGDGRVGELSIKAGKGMGGGLLKGVPASAAAPLPPAPDPDRADIEAIHREIETAKVAGSAADEFLRAFSRAKSTRMSQGSRVLWGKRVTEKVYTELLDMAEAALSEGFSVLEIIRAASSCGVSFEDYLLSLKKIRDDAAVPASARIRAAEMVFQAPLKAVRELRAMRGGGDDAAAAPGVPAVQTAAVPAEDEAAVMAELGAKRAKSERLEREKAAVEVMKADPQGANDDPFAREKQMVTNLENAYSTLNLRSPSPDLSGGDA